MHDLLARLGREIVRKQSPNEPGRRQFLVDDGDICQVLRNDTIVSFHITPTLQFSLKNLITIHCLFILWCFSG